MSTNTYAELPPVTSTPPVLTEGHFSACEHTGTLQGIEYSSTTEQVVYKKGHEKLPFLTTDNILFPKKEFPQMYDATTGSFIPFASKAEMIKAAVDRQAFKAEQRGKVSGPKERENCELGTEFSTQTRGDIRQTIDFNGKQIVLEYNMSYNSAMNGLSYLNENKQTVTILGGTSASLNRDSETITLLRQIKIQDPQGQWHTVCCAGRPDSSDKIRKEFIPWLFMTYFDPETNTGKGITFNAQTNEYEIDLASISLISTFALPKAQGESKIIEGQYKDLKDFLKEGGRVTFEANGKTYTVKANIWFLERQFNFMNRLEENLSPALSGKSRAQEMTDDIALLEVMLKKEIQQHGAPANIAQINQALTDLKEHLERPFLTPMQELFSFLFVLQMLPHNINCRSSCDRTGLLVTLDSALITWMKMGYDIPANPYELLQNEEFKKLWFALLPPAVLMSFYSRNTIGLKWQTKPVPYITIHPAALELMPKEALTDFYIGNPELKKFKWSHIFTGLVPLAILHSPVKSMTNCWFHSVKNPVFRALITALFQPIIALISLGVLTVELGLAFVLATLWGLLSTVFSMWVNLGLIKKESTLGRYADPSGLMQGLALVYATLFDLPTSQVVKDDAEVAGLKIMFGKQKKAKGKKNKKAAKTAISTKATSEWNRHVRKDDQPLSFNDPLLGAILTETAGF